MADDGRLDAISRICADASIGKDGQSVVARVRELHAELGRQIDRADKAEAERDELRAELRRLRPDKPESPAGWCEDCQRSYAECVCFEEEEERLRCGCRFCFCHNETEYGETCHDCLNHAHQG